MATSRDVAKLAGVSQATVSRVLSGKTRVRPETERKVLHALEQTGYVPNGNARAMRARRTGTLGVVTGRITNPFYPELLDGLAQSISRRGLRMALWASDTDSGESAAVGAIQERMIDGLIFTTAAPESEALKNALSLGLPLVLANRSLDEVRCDQVTTDNFDGGRTVARYFLSAGHERVAVVGGLESVSTSRDRFAGFLRGCADRGIEVPPPMRAACEFTHDDALQVGRELLAGDDRPTAVFCVGDVIAIGLLDAAIELGLRVPDDLWVVGYDAIPMTGWKVVDLTSVSQPIATIAETAVETLLRRIESPETPFEHRRFNAELVVRGSTANHPFRR